jgi:hypothetical protein
LQSLRLLVAGCLLENNRLRERTNEKKLFTYATRYARQTAQREGD